MSGVVDAVQELNGEISVTTKHGEGTQWLVLLPLMLLLFPQSTNRTIPQRIKQQPTANTLSFLS